VPIRQGFSYQNVLSNEFGFWYQGDTVCLLTDPASAPIVSERTLKNK
jgi:hypothetical protein